MGEQLNDDGLRGTLAKSIPSLLFYFRVTRSRISFCSCLLASAGVVAMHFSWIDGRRSGLEAIKVDIYHLRCGYPDENAQQSACRLVSQADQRERSRALTLSH